MSEKVLIFIIFGLGIALFVGWIVFLNIYGKKKQKENNKSQDNDNDFEKKVFQNYKSFDFGKFGSVDNGSVHIDFNLSDLNEKLEKNMSEEEAIDYTHTMIQNWQERVLKHNNYFVNYFMLAMIQESMASDNQFWDNYLTNEDYSDDECAEIFSEIATKEFEQSLTKYLDIDTELDIGDVIKENFKFFDYDKFLSSIKIEYLYLTIDNEMSIQLSDKHQSAFVGAYEIFDEDLNGKDWHNF